MRSKEEEDLSKAAYILADEIWDGKWKHVSDLSSKPVPDCIEIINELEKRCPGHEKRKYERAIAQGMFESR